MSWITNKYYVSLFIAFLFVSLYSCDTEIAIEIPEPEKKMVVHSLFTPFTPPYASAFKLQLWSSYPILDTTKAKQIADAEVLLYIDGIISDTLHFNDSFGGYTNAGFSFLKEGGNYGIRISKSGYQSVSAINSIPFEVEIENLEVNGLAGIDEFKSAYSSVSITFHDPVEIQNFYEIIISSAGNQHERYRLWTTEKIITEESYYPSILAFDKKKPKRLLFNDKLINGEKRNVIVYYEPPQRENPDHRWINYHFIDIQLRSVTEAYYNYYTSLIQHSYSQEEDILYGMGEPIDVHGNIKGGYGLFAGFSSDLKTCFIDTVTVY